jgi:hypothetical protein
MPHGSEITWSNFCITSGVAVEYASTMGSRAFISGIAREDGINSLET